MDICQGRWISTTDRAYIGRVSRELGRRIRAARVYAGFDGRPELAKILETSEPTLQRIELGDRAVKRPELLAIAEACKVPMWFLERGWDGWRSTEPSEGEMGTGEAKEPRPHSPRSTGGVGRRPRRSTGGGQASSS